MQPQYSRCGLPWNYIFHQRVSSIIGCLYSKFIFHQRLFSIKSCLLSKVIFNQNVPSINNIFLQRLSIIKGYLSLEVIFHQSLSSIKGCLQSKCIKPMFNKKWSDADPTHPPLRNFPLFFYLIIYFPSVSNLTICYLRFLVVSKSCENHYVN